MATTFKSSRCNVREMRPEDASVLQSIATHIHNHGFKTPWILEKSARDNSKLAHAYSVNKEQYPYAYVLCDEKNEAIGCLVAQKFNPGELEVGIVLDPTKYTPAYAKDNVLSEFADFAVENGYKVI